MPKEQSNYHTGAQPNPKIMLKEIAKIANNKKVAAQNGQLIIQGSQGAPNYLETKSNFHLFEGKNAYQPLGTSNVNTSVVSIPPQKLNFSDIESIANEIVTLQTAIDASPNSFIGILKAQALKQFTDLLGSTPITELDLSKINFAYANNVGMEKIQKALETLKQVQYLNAEQTFRPDNVNTGCYNGDFRVHYDLIPIVTAIGSFSNLHKLNLGNNQLNELYNKNFELIANALGQLTQLRELTLYKNNLGDMDDKGIMNFSNAIGKLINLRMLDLYSNRVH